MLPSSTEFFVYGSMRDRDVLEVVLERGVSPADYRPAYMIDHRVVRVPGETYPVLSKANGEKARGDLVSGFGPEDLRRIAFFESIEYQFKSTRVMTPEGELVEALYCSEARIPPGAVDPWVFEAWRATYKVRFLELAREFMSFYGTGTLADADAFWLEAETRLHRAG
jgi:hypothetical protein